MSKLYGGLSGKDKTVTRQASISQRAYVQTEYGRIEVFMLANGEYEVTRYVVRNGYTVDSAGTMIAKGNVNQEVQGK